jgi:hypothetical protein
LFDGKAVSQIPQKRSLQRPMLRIKKARQAISKEVVDIESSDEESSAEVENESTEEESSKEVEDESSVEESENDSSKFIAKIKRPKTADAYASGADSVGAESVEELLNDQAQEIVSKLLDSPKSREFLAALFLKLPLDLKKEMANYK